MAFLKKLKIKFLKGYEGENKKQWNRSICVNILKIILEAETCNMVDNLKSKFLKTKEKINKKIFLCSNYTFPLIIQLFMNVFITNKMNFYICSVIYIALLSFFPSSLATLYIFGSSHKQVA